MTMTRLAVPTFDDLNAAARRLEGIAHRTPVLRSTSADESTGAQVFFKCENLQRTGAFKFRGAYNTLARFTPNSANAACWPSLRATTHRRLRCRHACLTCPP